MHVRMCVHVCVHACVCLRECVQVIVWMCVHVCVCVRTGPVCTECSTVMVSGGSYACMDCCVRCVCQVSHSLPLSARGTNRMPVVVVDVVSLGVSLADDEAVLCRAATCPTTRSSLPNRRSCAMAPTAFCALVLRSRPGMTRRSHNRANCSLRAHQKKCPPCIGNDVKATQERLICSCQLRSSPNIQGTSSCCLPPLHLPPRQSST